MTDYAKLFVQNVRDGKVSGFSIDPDNPAMAYDQIDIYVSKGRWVRFTGHGGYTHHQETARKHLKVDGIYTIERTDIGAWHTDVYLHEVPGIAFNSVMFADADTSTSDA